MFFSNLENETVNLESDTVNLENDTVFSLIKQNKHITASEIGQRLNLNLATVKRKMKELKNNGQLERVGSDKTGHWKIIE